MTEEERAQFTAVTGRETPPVEPVQECWLVVGRRGGKSFIVALVAVWLACFKDYRPFLGPGERGVVMVIATDRKQSRVIMRYALALPNAVPMLAAMIQRQDSGGRWSWITTLPLKSRRRAIAPFGAIPSWRRSAMKLPLAV